MAKFNAKELKESSGKAVKFIKKNPSLAISSASLGVAGVNLSINKKRQKEAKEIADKQLDLSNKQLDMMNKQMNVIKENTKALQDSVTSQKEISNAYRESALHNTPKEPEEKPKRKSLFKRRLFSIKSSTIAGAQIGMGLATLGATSPTVTKFTGNQLQKVGMDGFKKLKPIEQKISLVSAGVIIGAALGALVGTVGEIEKKISRRSVNNRLLPVVISNLKKDNLKEGVNFTRDPKTADQLKTRVCIAISKHSGSLRLLINTKSDPKLQGLTNSIIKNIPNMSVENKTARNDYNEIMISTISDSSADATLISGIAEQFIHSGFPVYLVEVG